jgi:hypothetical protein
MPEGLADRAADVWEPLLAVADAAGGDWPARARVAAVALVAAKAEKEPSLGVRLLADIRAIFDQERREALPTAVLLERLHRIEEAPWGDIRGKPLDARGLARRLAAYGIRAKTIRVGSDTPRGYERTAFEDAWARYLPTPAARPEPSPAPSTPSASPSRTSATSKTSATGAGCESGDGPALLHMRPRVADVSATPSAIRNTGQVHVADVADVLDLRRGQRENGTGTGAGAGAGADMLSCRRCGAPTPAQAPVGGAGYRWGQCPVCGYVTYVNAEGGSV